MSLIVDGYNVILSAGLLEGTKRGVQANDMDSLALNRARFRLIERVAKHSAPGQVAVVVFDAKNPPPGAPKKFVHLGVTVMFAVDYDEADDLIEHLIRVHSTPKKLLVVSSDHRLQAAARRRKATYLDVDDWLDRIEAVESKQSHDDRSSQTNQPIQNVIAANESVDEWLDFLEIEDADSLVDSLSESDQRDEEASEDSKTIEATEKENSQKNRQESFAELFGEDFQVDSIEEVGQLFSNEWLAKIQDDLDSGRL